MFGVRNNVTQEVEGIYLSESPVNYSGAWLSRSTLEAILSFKPPLIVPPADHQHTHGSVTISSWRRGIAPSFPPNFKLRCHIILETTLQNCVIYGFKSRELASFFKATKRTKGSLKTLPAHPLPQRTGGKDCELFLMLSSEPPCSEKNIWELGGKGIIKEGRSPLRLKYQTVHYIWKYLIDSYQNAYHKALNML